MSAIRARKAQHHLAIIGTPEAELSTDVQPMPTPIEPQKPAAAIDPIRLVDVHVASAKYGVSWRTFLRYADLGIVPFGRKLGGRRLWLLTELDAHILGGCRRLRP